MRYACVVALLLLASGVLGQKVRVDYKKDLDFTRYKTYGWDRGMPARNPLIDKMIVEAIERELASRGFTKKDGDADVVVVYAAAVGADVNMSYGSRGNTGAPQQTGMPIGDTSWSVAKGSISVTLMDAKSKNLIWQGSASDTLAAEPSNDMQKDAKRVEKQVHRSVEKMFKKYPVAANAKN
jgi:Domain of unknown function (DUF4136)